MAEKRRRIYKIIVAAAILVYEQRLDGGEAHWEWPRWAECHDVQVVQRMVTDVGFRAAYLDGCQVGTKHLQTGELYLKPWTTYTTSATMLQAMSLRCPRNH